MVHDGLAAKLLVEKAHRQWDGMPEKLRQGLLLPRRGPGKVPVLPASHQLLVDAPNLIRHTLKQEQTATLKKLRVGFVLERGPVPVPSRVDANLLLVYDVVREVADTAPAVVERQARQRAELPTWEA